MVLKIKTVVFTLMHGKDEYLVKWQNTNTKGRLGRTVYNVTIYKNMDHFKSWSCSGYPNMSASKRLIISDK